MVIDPAFTVAEVDERLFGSFVEHMGRAVYGGIYEPGHPTADEDGFRGDVLELTRELGVTVVRYPGGNFVSGYDWEDGVGPRSSRPTRLDLAWRSIESNEVGTDEFMAWARKAGAEPMLAVNLGTRGVDAARSLVEYCNAPAGSRYADWRADNGHPEPHGVRLWCLGNEMDGPWQVGQKTAVEYGRIAAEAGKAMRLVDPSVELCVVGSSNPHHTDVTGPFKHAPALAEDDHSVADALVVGCLLITLLRHADRVRIGCLAQLVNVIPPMRTLDGGPAWRQTSFYPFMHASRFGRGTVLRLEPGAPTYDVDGEGAVAALEATAVLDAAGGSLTLFGVNRADAALPIEAVLRDLDGVQVDEHIVLTDRDLAASNTAAQPDRVAPSRGTGATIQDGVLRAELPPRSWNVLRLGGAR